MVPPVPPPPGTQVPLPASITVKPSGMVSTTVTVPVLPLPQVSGPE